MPDKRTPAFGQSAMNVQHRNHQKTIQWQDIELKAIVKNKINIIWVNILKKKAVPFDQ